MTRSRIVALALCLAGLAGCRLCSGRPPFMPSDLIVYVTDSETGSPVAECELRVLCDGRPVDPMKVMVVQGRAKLMEGPCTYTVTASAPGYEEQTKSTYGPREAEDECEPYSPAMLRFALVPIPGYVPDAGVDGGDCDAGAAGCSADAGAGDANGDVTLPAARTDPAASDTLAGDVAQAHAARAKQ